VCCQYVFRPVPGRLCAAESAAGGRMLQSSGEYFCKEQYDALIQLSMIGDKSASDNIKPGYP
jgi:hypothetical protein